MTYHALVLAVILIATLVRLAHRDTLCLLQRIGMILMAGGAMLTLLKYLRSDLFWFIAEQVLLTGVALIATIGAWRTDTRRRKEDKRQAAESPGRKPVNAPAASPREKAA